MKKRIFSCTLAVALIATMGTVAFAKDGSGISNAMIKKLEAEIGKMNVPEHEKSAVIENLQQAKNEEASKSEKASESLGSRIKSFFKNHWGKILGIGAAVLAVVIAVATIFTVRHCRNGSNGQEIQTDVSQDSETQEVQNEFQAPTEGTEVPQKKYTEQELLTIFTTREDAFEKEIGKCKSALERDPPDFQAAKEAAIAAQSIAQESHDACTCTKGYDEQNCDPKLYGVGLNSETAKLFTSIVVKECERDDRDVEYMILMLNNAQTYFKEGITELKNGGN